MGLVDSLGTVSLSIKGRVYLDTDSICVHAVQSASVDVVKQWSCGISQRIDEKLVDCIGLVGCHDLRVIVFFQCDKFQCDR